MARGDGAGTNGREGGEGEEVSPAMVPSSLRHWKGLPDGCPWFWAVIKVWEY